jgi:Cof subfamily protein (haloacid dehalogenase superfamily)
MTMIAREGTNSAGRAAGFGCLISSFSVFSPCLRASVADSPAGLQQPESNRHPGRLETAVSRCKQTSATSSNRPSIPPLQRANLPASLPPSRLLQRPASGLQHLDSHYNAGVPIKLIAMDLDGTLLDSASQLHKENAAAIEEAAAQGLEIVIVTGRRFDSARAAADLACDAHFISSNGALIKSKDGITHQRHLLPAAAARKVLDATPEFRFCTGVIFDRPHARQLIFERVDWDSPFVGSYLRRHRDQVAEIAPLADCLDGEDPVEILFLAKCDEIRRVMGVLEALPSAHEFALALTEYESRNFSMLDVLRPGVTKGVALAEWARHRGIAPQDVMAIGDNWNDREMLAYAGLPVVMGNSIAELKTLGYATTLSNDDAGVAAAIRKYALGTKP